MRKNLVALYTNETRFQKMPEQNYMKKKKSTANKLRNRQSKIFEKKQDSLDYSGTQSRSQLL